MPTQNATTGNLAHAQRIVVAQCLFTAEHNAPCVNLITNYKLGKGEKSMTVPKVSQATAAPLTDGVDMVDSQDIGLSYTSLTTNEVGLKFILTDKLVRQFNEDVFRVIGRQMGDAMARKRDTDVIALFTALNGNTALGGATAHLSMVAASGCIARLQSVPAPKPWFFVHHPIAIADLSKGAAAIGATYYAGILDGFSEERVRNFWKINISDCNFFHDGNIAAGSGVSAGYGAVASKDAMCFIESQGITTERDRDASMRGTEVVMVSDYGAFELDDSYGFPAYYWMATIVTT